MSMILYVPPTIPLNQGNYDKHLSNLLLQSRYMSLKRSWNINELFNTCFDNSDFFFFFFPNSRSVPFASKRKMMGRHQTSLGLLAISVMHGVTWDVTQQSKMRMDWKLLNSTSVCSVGRDNPSPVINQSYETLIL